MKHVYQFKEYDPGREEYYGTLLALANGRIGVRGELELVPSRYGFFLAGIYDYTPVFYRELVNFPRVNGVYVIIDSRPLDPSTCESLDMVRILDIYRGVLETRMECWFNGINLSYESTRLVHRRYKNIVLQYSRITLDRLANIIIEAPIELDKTNPLVPENISIKHYRLRSARKLGDKVLVDLETIDGKYRVAIASETLVNGAPLHTIRKTRDRVSSYHGLHGSKVEITRLISIASSRETRDPVGKAVRILDEALGKSYGELVREHSDEWKRIWDDIDFTVKGDPKAEKKLLFYAFHLLQLVDEEQEYLMIPARGLHGIGYRGHVFWDTDLYTIPFYSLLAPWAARKILLYRYAMLDKARENARLNGYQGAQYPWESCDDGVEATPKEIPLDVLGRKKIRIWTGEREQHITADIAYAVHLYYEFTRDEEFMANYGLEIIFETARFWASRVEYDDLKGKYVIRDVMGPDEYHPRVDNSFYTNVLAKKNLELAVQYYYRAIGEESWRNVVDRLGIRPAEVETWKHIADNMYIPCGLNGLCEEFEGYFELEDKLSDAKGYGIAHPADLESVEKTRLIKQADVIAAMFFLADEFDEEAMAVNYDYYLPRTTHESSLSLPTYAGVAALIGRAEEAWRLLSLALKTDLEDLYGNTREGFHVAAAGGIWAALLLGFLRLRVKEGSLKEIRPVLPPGWRGLKIALKIGGERRLVNVV